MQHGDVRQYCYAVFWYDVHVQTVGHRFSSTSRQISAVVFTHLSFSDVLQYDTMLNKNKKYKLKEKSKSKQKNWVWAEHKHTTSLQLPPITNITSTFIIYSHNNINSLLQFTMINWHYIHTYILLCLISLQVVIYSYLSCINAFIEAAVYDF